MEDFFTKGNNIAESIINNMPELSRAEKIEFARNNTNKDTLKSFIIISNIQTKLQKLAFSNSSEIRLSIDTIIKNRIEHPEICLKDYKNLNCYIQNADYIFYKNNKNLIYYKKDNKIFCIVIKTTKNKQENYITTFHIAGNKQLQKDIKRYKKIEK